MSDAIFHNSVAIGRPARIRAPIHVPLGFGLLIAVAVSLGLWAGIIWIIARMLG